MSEVWKRQMEILSIYPIPDLDGGHVHVGAVDERQANPAGVCRGGRRQRLDAVDRAERVLERPDDDSLDLFGRRRRVAGLYRDVGRRETGQKLERQSPQRQPSQDHHAEDDQ